MFSLATSSSTPTRIASPSSSSSLKNNTKCTTKRQPQQRGRLCCVTVAGNNNNDNDNNHHHQQQHRGNKAALLAATVMLISSSPIIHPETAFAEVTCNLVTPCTMPPPNGEPRYIMPSSQYDPAKEAEEKFMKQLEAKRNKTATANAAVVEEEPKAVAPEAASE